MLSSLSVKVFALLVLFVAAITASVTAAQSESDPVRRANDFRLRGNAAGAVEILAPLAPSAQISDEQRGVVWNILGLSYQDLELLDKAKYCYEQAINASRLLRSQEEQYAAAIDNLGSVEQSLGKLDESERLRKKAKTIYSALGNHAGVARILNNLAVTALRERKWAAAQGYIEKALQESKMTTELSDDDIAAMLSVQGNLAIINRDPRTALTLFQEAIEHWGRLHGSNDTTVGHGLMLRAQAYRNLNDFSSASSDLQQAMCIFKGTLGDTSVAYLKATLQKAQLLRDEGNTLEAVSLEKKAADGFKSLSNDGSKSFTVTVEALR